MDHLMNNSKMVQWPSSIAKHAYDYNSYWEEYVWSSRINNHRSKRLADQENFTTTTTSTEKYILEDKKTELRTNARSTNIKNSTAINLTKSFFKTNNSSMQPNNGLKPQQTKSSSMIIFPNSSDEKMATVSLNKFVPEPQAIEKCAMNESFCLKVDSYPRQDLQRIFRTSKFISNAFFGVDTINEFETRISTDLQPFCESLEKVIFPEVAITKNNEWRYIIQDLDGDSNFKQGIRIETCENPGPCKFNENLPQGYTTTCVQKYIYKKLVAIKDSKEIYYDSFRLPSCCACMYSVKPELLTRKYGEPESRKMSSRTEPSKLG